MRSGGTEVPIVDAGRGLAAGASAPVSQPKGLWGRSFRPFFLGGAAFAALAIPVWTLVWLGALPGPTWLIPAWWHGHEMIFGFVAAAVAGFLLTASPVWTGGPAVSGRPLAVLMALWIAGRLAFAAVGLLPVWLVAAVDVGFLPAVAVAMARTLRGSGQLRNHAILGIVVVLALANATMHAEALGWVTGVAGRALRFAVDGVVVLLLVIGGRITPAFTRNAFQREGSGRTVRSRPWLDLVAIGAAAALALATVGTSRSPVTGLLAAIAGMAAAARLVGWQSWHTRRDPLLWSLHVGGAWVALGLLLVAASDLGAPVPPSSGLHALTAGAMGVTIVAVMTRVGLGHTGRPLVLPDGVVWCYGLVNVAALARTAAPMLPGGPQRISLWVAAAAWAGAFGLFAIFYGPILVRARPDGKSG
jgi:uncharacterized protein involved in response to NO